MSSNIKFIERSDLKSLKAIKGGLSSISSFSGTGIGGIKASIPTGGGGGGLRYPVDLPAEKYVRIGVYNTSDADKVQAGLAGIGAGAVQAAEAAFKGAADVGKSALDGIMKKSGIGDVASGIGNAISQAGKGVWGGIKNAFNSGTQLIGDTLKSAYNTAQNMGKNGVGNPKLARSWVTNIYLPLPNELQESYSHSYEAQDGWINDMPGMDTVKSTVEKATKVSATLAKMTGGRQIQYYENKLQMYSGTEFREVTLTWDLVPSNSSEAGAIQEIVRSLKAYSSAESKAGKLLVQAPNFFGLFFSNPIVDSALRFHEVVLTNVSASYTPGGTMEVYHDQMPKVINLSLSFRDREPKLREDWSAMPGAMQGGGDASCQQGAPGGNQTGQQGTGGTSSTGKGKSAGGINTNTKMVNELSGDVYDDEIEEIIEDS